MLKLSPRCLLSPRFLALPVIALSVIVALAQASRETHTLGTQIATSKVYRAVNCASPVNAGHASCAIAAGANASRVR
jgi:hypothetical protein